jgi:hypothetical protein
VIDKSVNDNGVSNRTPPPLPQPRPHLEIFNGTVQAGLIFVACACPIGEDHSYEDGLQYRGPVDASVFRGR